MSTGYSWEGIRQVRATLRGARHVPGRLCGGRVYLGRYIKCSTFTFTFVVRGTAYSVGRPVFWWSQSRLYATALGSESVYLWCDPVTWPEKLN